MTSYDREHGDRAHTQKLLDDHERALAASDARVQESEAVTGAGVDHHFSTGRIPDPNGKSTSEQKAHAMHTQMMARRNVLKSSIRAKVDQGLNRDFDVLNKKRPLKEGWNTFENKQIHTLEKIHARNGKRDGITEVYCRGVLRRRDHYEDDLLHGECLRYDPKGALIAKLHYVRGQKQGESEFFQAGRLAAVSDFVDDKRAGPMVAFDANGNPKSKILFAADKKQGTAEFYNQEGTIIATVEFEDDRKNGYLKQYYKTGELKKIEYYKDDIVDGEVREYYKDGTRKSEMTFAHGKVVAAKVQYNEKGKEIPPHKSAE